MITSFEQFKKKYSPDMPRPFYMLDLFADVQSLLESKEPNVSTPEKWIDFSKEKPKESNDYLVVNASDMYDLGYWSESDQTFSDADGIEYIGVAHWMPLPELPKAQQ